MYTLHTENGNMAIRMREGFVNIDILIWSKAKVNSKLFIAMLGASAYRLPFGSNLEGVKFRLSKNIGYISQC